VGCLALALTYAFKDFCQLTLLVFAQEFTLITSLSEFISVFKQPTLSVVFRDIIYRYLEFSSFRKNLSSYVIIIIIK